MPENVILPAIDPTRKVSEEQHGDVQVLNLDKVLSFCFPTRTLEGESPLGRLEVLARFGPLDSDGQLRSGYRGDHVLTAGEVKQMTYDLHARRWQKKLKRDFVDDLVLCTLGVDPTSKRSAYSPKDVRAILSDVTKDDDHSAIELSQLQDAVLTYVKSRFRNAYNSVIHGRPLVARMDNPVKEMEHALALRKKQGRDLVVEESLKQQKCLLLGDVVNPGRNPIDIESTLQALGTEANSPKSARSRDSPRMKELSPRPPPESPENRERKLRAMRRKEMKANKDQSILWGSKQLTGSISKVGFSKEAVVVL